jgi:HicB family
VNHYTYRVEWSPDCDDYIGVCKYNGTFVVRTSQELHARLAREAIEQCVSMNQWVVQKLSGRELPSGLGLFGLD